MVLSPAPTPTMPPSLDQAGRIKFFSNPWGAPSSVFKRRLPVAENGFTSQIRTVLSIPFERSWLPSGDNAIPETVSMWPVNEYDTVFLRISQAAMLLSMPPAKTRSPASENDTDVIWYCESKLSTAFFALRSQIYYHPSQIKEQLVFNAPRAFSSGQWGILNIDRS